jgi:hypothetical protein
MSFRSRITGLMTCVTAVVAVISLRFGRGVFLGMLERSNSGEPALSRITLAALTITNPAFLLLFLVVCVGAVVVSEVKVKTEAGRLLAQAAVLQAFVLLLAIALSGFLISFDIPDVTIQ